MSTIQGIPPSRTAIVDVGGTASRPWYLFFQNVSTTLTSQQAQIDALVVASGGSSGGLPSTSNVIGQNSILSQGVLANGIVTITLAGDVGAPGNTYYYGTNGTGVKSFYTISSALVPSSNVTLTTDVGGQVTFDLSDVTPDMSGRLYGLAFDAKGRLSEQHTIDVVGVSNRTTVTGGDGSGATIGVDIAATYAGQTSITTLGTITTGTWNGSLVGVQYGGTGANLSATGGAGQYVKQSTVGGALTVGTIPASDIGSGQALTATNDTNVTITLGGTPASSLLKATSITMGWTGTLSIARGGTGQTTANAAYNALSPMTTNGDIEIRAGGVATRLGVGSAGQVLGVSGGLPAWVAAGGGGTVTSVGLAAPTQFSVSGSPVTGSGTLTLAWANESANTALMGPASGSAAAPTFRALVSADVPLPTDYISGLKLIWNNATSISVGTGSAVIPSTGKLEVVSSTLTLSSLSLSASTFYHVYLFDNAGTPTIECVTTAPASPYQGTARAKTGDTTRRYMGSVLTDASSNINNFNHASGQILYKGNLNSAPFVALSGGTATAETAVSMSGVVPVGTTVAIIRNTNGATVGSGVNNRLNNGSVTFPAFVMNFVAGTDSFLPFVLNSSLGVTYWYPAAPGGSGLTIQVLGYQLER